MNRNVLSLIGIVVLAIVSMAALGQVGARQLREVRNGPVESPPSWTCTASNGRVRCVGRDIAAASS
jgi:hypothetical protein